MKAKGACIPTMIAITAWACGEDMAAPLQLETTEVDSTIRSSSDGRWDTRPLWDWDSVGVATGEPPSEFQCSTMVPPSPECCDAYPYMCAPCTSPTIQLDPATIPPGGTISVEVQATADPMTVCQVQLEAIGIEGSGDHIHSGRPVGQFQNASGSALGGGYFTTYAATQFGGQDKIRATIGTGAAEATLTIKVAGLSALGASSNYTLDGDTPSHPTNHYGTSTAIAGINSITGDYMDEYPGSGLLEVNDMSLVNGGLFDIGPPYGVSWQTPHHEHRLGKNVDLETTGIPTSRYAFLEDLFETYGSPNFLREFGANHWHLRF